MLSKMYFNQLLCVPAPESCLKYTIDKIDLNLLLHFAHFPGQVFLWLQEKGIFGEGSLLFNPTPGKLLLYWATTASQT